MAFEASHGAVFVWSMYLAFGPDGYIRYGAEADPMRALASRVVSMSEQFGVLNYNCVGLRDSWAKANKPGVAYVRVLTHYELNYASPGGPPTIYTFVEPDSLEAMQADVESLRSQVDVLTVAFH